MNNIFVNVAYSLDDRAAQLTLIFMSAIRDRVLDYISSIPYFDERSRRVKCYYYDRARKEIGRAMSREAAMRYQEYFADNALTYEQIAQYQAFFNELATAFDLVDEFTENGII